MLLLASAVAQTNSNIDDTLTSWVQGSAGWKPVCIKPACDPGGSGIPTSTGQTINNTNPSRDGASMKISITGPANTNALWPYVAGVRESATHFSVDFWVYPSANFNLAQTFETDMYLFSTVLNKEFMFGMQCNQVGHFWQVWNMLAFLWVNTSVACSLPPLTWTHIQQAAHRVVGDTNGCSGQPCMHYDTLVINGVSHAINMTEPAGPLPSGWLSDVGWQPQIDIGASGTGGAPISLNFDNVNFTTQSLNVPNPPTSPSAVVN